MKILSKLNNTGMIEEVADKRYVTDAEKLTWNGKADKTYVDSQDALKADKTYVDNKVKTDVPVGAKFTDTIYTHPTSHPASMITESSTKRFVSDSEKLAWNSKPDTDTITTINGKTGAISKADIVALGIPASDTNTTYTEITTAEIDTGTSSTRRTITARRLQYLLDKIVALFPTKTSELTNDSGFLTRWPKWSEVTGKPTKFPASIDTVYPIGSIYLSVVNTNPSTYFGGTWVSFGSGRTLVGVNTSDTAFSTVEKTGGAKTNTLSVANLPAHTHTFTGNATGSAGGHSHTITVNSGGSHTHTASTASAGAHSHQQDNRTWMNIASLVRMPSSGSYYATTNQSGEGGVGTTLSAGAHTHTVTVNSGGSHSHTASSNSTGAHTHTVSGTNANTGSGTSFTTLDPYITVYMWKRTA